LHIKAPSHGLSLHMSDRSGRRRRLFSRTDCVFVILATGCIHMCFFPVTGMGESPQTSSGLWCRCRNSCQYLRFSTYASVVNVVNESMPSGCCNTFHGFCPSRETVSYWRQWSCRGWSDLFSLVGISPRRVYIVIFWAMWFWGWILFCQAIVRVLIRSLEPICWYDFRV
jgi:hypothetical protein